MWIVDDEFDAGLPLPRGERDLALMIGDRSFDRHNQLTDPFTNLRPPGDGIAADRILVNGAYMPYHRVRPQRYRLRILNVSQFRSYNLRLANGAPLVQIGTDSGLMPRPVQAARGDGRAGRASRAGGRFRPDGGGARGAAQRAPSRAASLPVPAPTSAP